MSVKNFLGQLFRGWLPKEPNMPENLLQNSRMPMVCCLKMTNSLKIVYTLTLGFASSVFLAWLILYFWQDWTPNVFESYLYGLPFLFFISSFPLAIFGITFLTKGNGLNYFKSWNAGKKIHFSGLTIVAGYVSITLLHILNIMPIIVQVKPSGGFSVQNNTSFPYFVFFGLSIMAIGLVSLLLIYKTTAKPEKVTGGQKKKTSKKLVALIIFTIILAVSFTCLAGLHYKLQREYDIVSEGYSLSRQPIARVVNEQWSDNVGVDSKYVNYKAGVLNFGFDTVYNVTVRVSVIDPNGTVLNNEEIFIEKINAVNYVTINTDIKYSGEMAQVSGVAFRWVS